MQTMDDQDYQQAQKQVRKLQHFYRHLLTYAVVIAFLHIVNLLTSDYYWAIWPTLGWGVGVALHATRHLDIFPFLNEEWEEKKIQEIIAKRRGQASSSSGQS